MKKIAALVLLIALPSCYAEWDVPKCHAAILVLERPIPVTCTSCRRVETFQHDIPATSAMSAASRMSDRR